MKKSEAIKHWKELDPGQDPLPSFHPIPYKTGGSKYGCCGIRIDGSPEFVDAVLSNLKTILAGENVATRLELSRRPVQRQEGYNAGQNAGPGAECCYIRLHVRGGEGAHMLAVFGGSEIQANSETYAKAIGAELPD